MGRNSYFVKKTWDLRAYYICQKLNLENQSIIQQRCVETATESSHPFTLQPILFDSLHSRGHLGWCITMCYVAWFIMWSYIPKYLLFGGGKMLVKSTEYPLTNSKFYLTLSNLRVNILAYNKVENWIVIYELV